MSRSAHLSRNDDPQSVSPRYSIEAIIAHPIKSPPSWRLSGTVRGLGERPDVEVSRGRLPASAPVVLDPVELLPYFQEWARAHGWQVVGAVELDLHTFPGRLRFYCTN